jgi:hypothetical protein
VRRGVRAEGAGEVLTGTWVCAGVFNHLSRSKESARALQNHGIMETLRRLVGRAGTSGGAEAQEAYVGLANMAMANIAVGQDASCAAESTGSEVKAGSVRFKVSSIKSIVGFLKCAVEGQQTSGIRFRVYDVLYALDSMCKCHERDLLGIECGLVDAAVQVTAEWRPGKYSSIFSDAKASTHPVLELSTDILVHLAQSKACKARMRELYLESILDRLLLTAEGRVRDHVLKVLWVLRDEMEARESAKKIVAHVDSLRQLSAKYDCGGQGQGGLGDVSGLLEGAVSKGDLDPDLQASFACINASVVEHEESYRESVAGAGSESEYFVNSQQLEGQTTAFCADTDSRRSDDRAADLAFVGHNGHMGPASSSDSQLDQELYIRTLERDARMREEHSNLLGMQLEALGEEVEALQQSVSVLSAEKARLALDVRDKDDRVLQVTRELLRLQRESEQKTSAVGSPESHSRRGTIHKDSSLSRSDAILLGIFAVMALVFMCIVACWFLEPESCPLIATADSQMLLDQLLGANSPHLSHPPAEADVNAECGKKHGLEHGGERTKRGKLKAWIF